MAKSFPHAVASGSTVTRHLEGNIIETVYNGQIAFDGSLDRDLEALLFRYPNANWLIDATRATGIDPKRRDTASDTIGLFRRMRGGTIVGVIPSGPIRMVASALSFGFDLRIRIFASRQEALDYLRSLP